MSDSICKNGSVRCILCGLFMGTDDIEDGYCEYTPDTAFSCEAIEWWHEKCYADWKKKHND